MSESEVEKQNIAGQEASRQVIIINQPEVKQSNGIGTTGFVVALVTLFFGWVPVYGWIVWGVGLICSLIGVFREPNRLAIAGVAISLLELAIIIIVTYFFIHSLLP